METNAAGTVIAQCTYAPFGQVVTCPTDDGANHYRFTGQERDTETGLDNFRAREFTSQFGRFSQPDPEGLAAVDPGNPQTWNRYSYTANNPINFVDPSGRHTCWDSVQTKYDTTIEFYDCPDALDPPLNAGLVSPFGMGWMPCGYTGSLCQNTGGGLGCLFSCTPPNPPPPPHWKDCLSAFRDDPNENYSKGLLNVTKYWGDLETAGAANGVDPTLLASIALQESHFNPSAIQGNGNGVGAFQIDLGQNPGITVSQAQNVSWSANWGRVAEALNPACIWPLRNEARQFM